MSDLEGLLRITETQFAEDTVINGRLYMNLASHFHTKNSETFGDLTADEMEGRFSVRDVKFITDPKLGAIQINGVSNEKIRVMARNMLIDAYGDVGNTLPITLNENGRNVYGKPGDIRNCCVFCMYALSAENCDSTEFENSQDIAVGNTITSNFRISKHVISGLIPKGSQHSQYSALLFTNPKDLLSKVKREAINRKLRATSCFVEYDGHNFDDEGKPYETLYHKRSEYKELNEYRVIVENSEKYALTDFYIGKLDDYIIERIKPNKDLLCVYTFEINKAIETLKNDVDIDKIRQRLNENKSGRLLGKGQTEIRDILNNPEWKRGDRMMFTWNCHLKNVKMSWQF